MKEEIVCIDDFLVDAWDFKCPNYLVSIYVRSEIYDEFIEFLGGKGINAKYIPGEIGYRFDKLISIATIAYANRYRDVSYRIEEKDKKPIVVAMKFLDKGRNDRLYCREIEFERGKYVIICEIYLGKKTEGLSKKEKNIIKRTRDYEFDLFS